jgi:hypothetical protein
MEIAWSHHHQQRALGKIRPGSLLNGAVSILTSPIAGERERRRVGGTGMPHASRFLAAHSPGQLQLMKTHHSPGRCQISTPSSDLPRPRPLQIWNGYHSLPFQVHFQRWSLSWDCRNVGALNPPGNSMQNRSCMEHDDRMQNDERSLRPLTSSRHGLAQPRVAAVETIAQPRVEHLLTAGCPASCRLARRLFSFVSLPQSRCSGCSMEGGRPGRIEVAPD